VEHTSGGPLRILLVDDDEDLCQLLEAFLAGEAFEVNALHDGAEALRHLRGHDYDIVVLDIMLPGCQGLEVLRELRRHSRVPVMMLTARGEDTDRIVGLEMGADDYLPKPFNPRELAARLRAIARRGGAAAAEDTHASANAGGVSLDPRRRSARYRGQPLELTSAEFAILHVLLRRAGEVVSKDELCAEGLKRRLSPLDRSVDVHISNIRKKLAQAGAAQLIVAVRGAGYQFIG